VQESPQNPWTSQTSHNRPSETYQQRRLPPTPRQRRLGNRIAIGVILAALAVIILLDHFHVIH
jgi:hypothetical protein